MADIVFTPTFHHTDWVDGQDPVEADDHPDRPDDRGGFNSRFNAIESDLEQMSTVVAQIDAAIAARAGAPTQQRITLPPTLVPAGGLQPWLVDHTGAAFAAPGNSASGVMNLSLPNGIRLVSFRALGQAAAVLVAISLARVTVGAGTAPEVIAAVTGDANPFDKSVPIDPTLAQVSTATFRYLIQASVPVTSPDTVTAVLAAFQIVYTAD